MTKHALQILAAALALAGGPGLLAQTLGPVRPQYEFPATPSKDGPGSVQLADSPFFLAPYLGFAGGNDSNLFQSADNEKSSALYIINPGLKLDARSPTTVFQASYLGAFGTYSSSRDDDYQDHTVRTSLDWLATREAAFRLGYDFLRGHDARGSTDRPTGSTPDEYDLSIPNLMFAYGQKGAQGRIEAYYSDAIKRYQNNRDITIGSDRDTQEGGLAAYFRIFPKTSIVAEYRKTEIDYKLSTSQLSGEEERFYGGIAWDATATTSGTIKVGRLKKKFDSALPGFSGTGWEAIVTWLPRTYSKVDLYTYRQPIESTGLGTFILSDAAGAVWTHAWNSFLSTEASVRFQKDKYQGDPRSDDLVLFGVKAGYKFRPWLTLGAEYNYSTRDSNQPVYDYDRHIWFLTAVITM